MKKPIIFLASLLAVAGAAAQTQEAPNRILVTNTGGNFTGYKIDYLSDISFATVEGEVKAELELFEVGDNMLKVSVQRTPSCYSYYLGVVPSTIANQLTDNVAVISYITNSRSGATLFFEDYPSADMTGIELKPDTKYELISVGLDNYGIADGVCRIPFATPAPEIVGEPAVDVKVDGVTLDSFTLTFTPNSDVSTYYCCAGEKGTMQQQYEMFGPMFGYSNFNEMIAAWGIPENAQTTKTWNNMAPNTEFEVFIAVKDVNGNFAPCQVFEVSTLSLGGPGDAWVDIDILEYELAMWGDEKLPSQYIEFTPNDQASCYRVAVYEASQYDADPEACREYVCSEPWMPTVGWYQYEAMVTDFQINPMTECVALAAAKNVNGVWGEINEVRFTTPEKADGMRPAKVGDGDVKSRIKLQPVQGVQPGRLPALARPRVVELK